MPAADPDRDLSPAARAAVADGMPANTRRAYTESCAEYATWCQETGRTALPATAETLTEYATYLAYTMNRAPSSVERARWAIMKAHRLAGVTPPPTDGLVMVLKGYRAHLAKTKDPKAKVRRASALTPGRLRAMLAPLDRATLSGCRDAALLFLSLFTAARVSELAAMDISDVELVQDKGLLITVYRGKVRKMQECPVEYASDPEVCPVRAVLAWITMLANHGRCGGPLFVRVDQHGNLNVPLIRNGVPIGDSAGRMTAEAIGEVVSRKGRHAALPGRWTGHSGRRGYVTTAYENGADRISIARGGGWDDNSRVVTGYIEDTEKWDKNPLRGVL